MSGIHSTTGVLYARDGLKAAIDAALAGDAEGVDVYSGFTWPVTSPDSVHMTDARGDMDPSTIATPRRSYTETITLGVNFLAWRAGEDDASVQAAYDRAFYLLQTVQDYVTNGDQTTLGGAVLWCLPGGISVDGEEYKTGFQVEIAATFICSHRVRAN